MSFSVKKKQKIKNILKKVGIGLSISFNVIFGLILIIGLCGTSAKSSEAYDVVLTNYDNNDSALLDSNYYDLVFVNQNGDYHYYFGDILSDGLYLSINDELLFHDYVEDDWLHIDYFTIYIYYTNGYFDSFDIIPSFDDCIEALSFGFNDGDLEAEISYINYDYEYAYYGCDYYDDDNYIYCVVHYTHGALLPTIVTNSYTQNVLAYCYKIENYDLRFVNLSAYSISVNYYDNLYFDNLYFYSTDIGYLSSFNNYTRFAYNNRDGLLFPFDSINSDLIVSYANRTRNGYIDYIYYRDNDYGYNWLDYFHFDRCLFNVSQLNYLNSLGFTIDSFNTKLTFADYYMINDFAWDFYNWRYIEHPTGFDLNIDFINDGFYYNFMTINFEFYDSDESDSFDGDDAWRIKVFGYRIGDSINGYGLFSADSITFNNYYSNLNNFKLNINSSLYEQSELSYSLGVLTHIFIINYGSSNGSNIYISTSPLDGAFTLIGNALGGTLGVLNVEVFEGISLMAFLFVPLVISLMIFLIHLFRG